MLKVNHTQYVFLSFYIDQFLSGRDVTYQGNSLVCTKLFTEMTVIDVIALKVLSMEQNVPIVLRSFPSLTSDLSICVDTVAIINGVLEIGVMPKYGVKRVKVHKQVKAALKKVRRIYPYYLFDEEDIVIIYGDGDDVIRT